jgi:CDP-diacylglycerol--glycerol-3-phosphate 3-phosphatidyltransferase
VAPGSRLTLPNVITLCRIAVCPVLFFLALADGENARYGAFVLFLAAAFSDVWDGWLARSRGLITDLGKLLDPLADKLLLAVSFIPLYLISHRPRPEAGLPFWGELPLWVLLVIFGRELFITLFRQWAQGRGVVIPAGVSGKIKALCQNLFLGGALFWYPSRMSAARAGWAWFPGFTTFLTWYLAITLSIALVLTVYSMFDYLWSYRSLVGLRH